MLKTRQVIGVDCEDEDLPETLCNYNSCKPQYRDPSSEPCSDHIPITRRVQISQSPFLDMFHGHHSVCETIDCGAIGNMISERTAIIIGAVIKHSAQAAYQADGRSPLIVIGGTQLIFVVTTGSIYLRDLLCVTWMWKF